MRFKILLALLGVFFTSLHAVDIEGAMPKTEEVFNQRHDPKYYLPKRQALDASSNFYANANIGYEVWTMATVYDFSIGKPLTPFLNVGLGYQYFEYSFPGYPYLFSKKYKRDEAPKKIDVNVFSQMASVRAQLLPFKGNLGSYFQIRPYLSLGLGLGINYIYREKHLDYSFESFHPIYPTLITDLGCYLGSKNLTVTFGLRHDNGLIWVASEKTLSGASNNIIPYAGLRFSF